MTGIVCAVYWLRVEPILCTDGGSLCNRI